MSDMPARVQRADLSPEQIYAAKLLARMWTWQRVSDEVGVSLTTIARWLRDERFKALVDENVRRVAEALENQLDEGLREMVALWIRMVRGEVDYDDGRLDRIEPFIRKLFDSAISWESPSVDHPASPNPPPVAVQFNIDTHAGGDREPPRLAAPGTA